MSLRPMKKRCMKCKRYYDWNPDVGKMFCPYCRRKRKKSILEQILDAIPETPDHL